jgi:hypothetical protein
MIFYNTNSILIISTRFFSIQVKTLRENVNNLKLLVISASKEIVHCDVNKLESNYYEVSFVPNLVERHNLEIYFEQKLMNKGRLLNQF